MESVSDRNRSQPFTACLNVQELRATLDRRLASRAPVDTAELSATVMSFIREEAMSLYDLGYVVNELQKARNDIDPELGKQYEHTLVSLVFIYDLCGGRGPEQRQIANDCLEKFK